MILVIPLKNNGSYEQLRFALRSITTHHDVTQCILVGGKPDWYIGTHIPHRDYGPVHKESNIRDKVIAGANYLLSIDAATPRLRDVKNANSGYDVIDFTTEFLFANDDHILLEPITTVYNKGLLSHCLSKRIGNGSYTRCLRNTLEHYGDVDNVDCHCPMMMDANIVHKTAFDWPDFGIGFKTCYAKENGIESEYYEDCKVDKVPVGRKWFSLTDNFPVRNLFGMFPEKSIFER